MIDDRCDRIAPLMNPSDNAVWKNIIKNGTIIYLQWYIWVFDYPRNWLRLLKIRKKQVLKLKCLFYYFLILQFEAKRSESLRNDFSCSMFSLRGKHSTVIRPRCDNILRWRMKLIFIFMFMRKVTVQNVICTQGLSLILVVLFSTYTEIETPFSFISIKKKVKTVCDHRYLEKRINIVGCRCILSTLWVKFFCWPWEDSLPDDKKVQRSNRKALSFHGSKTIILLLPWSFEVHPGG